MTADEVHTIFRDHEAHCVERQKVLHDKLDKLTRLVYLGYGAGFVGYGILILVLRGSILT